MVRPMSVAATDDPATSIRPLSRAEYERRIEEGFFEGERIELLEGVLVRMPPMKDRHARDQGADPPLHPWAARQL